MFTMIDLNVKGSSFDNNLIMAKQASIYGWKHINFSYTQNEYDDALSFKNDLKDNLKDVIDVDYTLLELNQIILQKLGKIVRKYRRNLHAFLF